MKMRSWMRHLFMVVVRSYYVYLQKELRQHYSGNKEQGRRIIMLTMQGESEETLCPFG